MARHREVPVEEMSPAQRRVRDEIIAGKRGRFGGPFSVLIKAPEICDPVQRLGEHLRWGSSLPPALSELAICIVARFWRTSLEWNAHEPLARQGGVSPAALDGLRRGERPDFGNREQDLVYRVCTALFEKKRLSDDLFNEVIAAFGEVGLIELAGIIGYYTMIGNALNVFEVPLPPGAAQPFPE